jgi:hypothetical protein
VRHRRCPATVTVDEIRDKSEESPLDDTESRLKRKPEHLGMFRTLKKPARAGKGIWNRAKPFHRTGGRAFYLTKQ